MRRGQVLRRQQVFIWPSIQADSESLVEFKLFSPISLGFGIPERPRSAVGKACSYVLGQWPGILTYLDHGFVEIDNKTVWRTPSALGKKNWLLIGEVKAGPRGADFYSLLGSCLRRGLNPRTYLHWLFTRIAAHAPHTMTPAAYVAFTAPAGQKAHAA